MTVKIQSELGNGSLIIGCAVAVIIHFVANVYRQTVGGRAQVITVVATDRP
jgi:hypothetical protein